MSADKNRYQFHNQEIARVQVLVNTYSWCGGMILYGVLREFPDDMLINIHFQYLISNTEFRRITCREALEKLRNSPELLMRVRYIQRDLDFGYDPERPIAVLEIPNPSM